MQNNAEQQIQNITFNNKSYNTEISCKSFDLVNSDQQNIISYIMHKNYIYTKYYPINYIHLNKINKVEFYDIHTAMNLNVFFIYNESHIWGVKNGTAMYKVDSMSGVHPFNTPLNKIKDIGIIVPVPIKQEWEYKMKEMHTILDKHNIKCRGDLADLLIKWNEEKKILGDLEIVLGVSISILETNIRGRDFIRITEIIELYECFIKQFTAGRYNDIELILTYVPDIIFKLTGLG